MIIFLVNSIEHLGRKAVLAQNSGPCGVLASRSTCEQSVAVVACPQTKHSAQDYLHSGGRVLKPPELWRGEAKANFGSAALLLT